MEPELQVVVNDQPDTSATDAMFAELVLQYFEKLDAEIEVEQSVTIH